MTELDNEAMAMIDGHEESGHTGFSKDQGDNATTKKGATCVNLTINYMQEEESTHPLILHNVPSRCLH